MAVLAGLDDYVSRLTASTQETMFWFRDNRIDGNQMANTTGLKFTSLWRFQGFPSHGAVPPTSAAAPDRTTIGSLGQANPTGGEELYLASASVTLGNVGTANTGVLLIYDRLLHNSGLSGTVTTAQTVGGSLTRYTGAAAIGNLMFAEINTLIGATGRTFTASYTNQDGTSGRISEPSQIGGTGWREAHRALIMNLAAGDTGVRSVESVTIDLTTGTAGDFGIVVMRPIAMIPLLLSGVGGYRDFVFQTPTLPKIANDACLSFMYLPSSAAASWNWFGHLSFITK